MRENGCAIQHDTVTAGAGVIAMRLPSLEECVERLSVGIAAPTQVLQQNKDDFILALHEEIASHLIGATNGNPTACLKTAAA